MRAPILVLLTALLLLPGTRSFRASQQSPQTQESLLKAKLAEMFRATSTAPIQEVGTGVSGPVLRKNPGPSRPSGTPAMDGTVEIVLVVKEDGTTGPALVLKGLAPVYDEAALEAAKQWRFLPARKEGVAVPVFVTILINFSGNR